jgi:hypothetical protein
MRLRRADADGLIPELGRWRPNLRRRRILGGGDGRILSGRVQILGSGGRSSGSGRGKERKEIEEGERIVGRI